MTTAASRARIIAPPLLLFVVCVAFGLLAHRSRPVPLLPDLPVLRLVVAFVLLKLSGLLAFSAFRSFKQHRTTVNPYGTPATLLTSGPFRYSRNPLYVSLLLLVLGLAAVSNTAWLVAAATIFFLLLHYGVVKPEETFLRSQFGAAYEQYCAQVRRWV